MSFLVYFGVRTTAQFCYENISKYPLRNVGASDDLSSLAHRISLDLPISLHVKEGLPIHGYGTHHLSSRAAISLPNNLTSDARRYFVLRELTTIRLNVNLWIWAVPLTLAVATSIYLYMQAGFLVADLIGYTVGTISSAAIKAIAYRRVETLAARLATPQEKNAAHQYYHSLLGKNITWREQTNVPWWSRLWRKVYCLPNGEHRFTTFPLQSRITHLK